MNLKRMLALGAIILIGFGSPAAYAGFRHHHHTSVAIGFGFSSFPYWGYGYYPYSSYGYGYYPYGYSYYPYGYGYSSSYYPYSYGYSTYRPAYRGQTAARSGSVVVQVQQRLSRAGYYHGRIDGVMGSRTRSAVRAWQRAHNLRVDGVINDQLLGTMGMRY